MGLDFEGRGGTGSGSGGAGRDREARVGLGGELYDQRTMGGLASYGEGRDRKRKKDVRVRSKVRSKVRSNSP